MTDIHIVDKDGKALLDLMSADNVKVIDVQEHLGNCNLVMDGVIRSINKSWTLVPGIYVATAKKQGVFHQDRLPSENNEKLRMLEKRLNFIHQRDSKAVSYSDYYKEKAKEGRVSAWTLPVVDNPEDLLPVALKNWKNLPKGKEEEVIKPCWQQLIKTGSLIPGHSVGYEVAYVGPKKPDVAIYPSNIRKPRAVEFEAFGDCKGEGWSGLSLSELGQALLYGHRILDTNPLRAHVYGFFTNNSIVVLIKCDRSRDAPYLVNWGVSAPLTFDQGMASFFRLFNDDNGFVAPPTVNSSLVSVRSFLGEGGTCRAFLADYNGVGVVAKLYKDASTVQEDKRKLADAVTALQSVERLCQIPTVIGSEGRWLLITPQGVSFTPFTLRQEHIHRLVLTLQTIHGSGIVHRDVRFANIFLIDGDEILLNDWGASTKGPVPVPVAGCPDRWAHPDLRRVADAVPLPKHDLYSLTSSFGDLVAPGLSKESQINTLKDSFRAAEICDYEALITSLVRHLPA